MSAYRAVSLRCFKMYMHLSVCGMEDKMELRTAVSPKDVKYYTTERLREEFLIQNLFTPGEIKLCLLYTSRCV